MQDVLPQNGGLFCRKMKGRFAAKWKSFCRLCFFNGKNYTFSTLHVAFFSYFCNSNANPECLTIVAYEKIFSVFHGGFGEF
jgi:hypothetical protein